MQSKGAFDILMSALNRGCGGGGGADPPPPLVSHKSEIGVPPLPLVRNHILLQLNLKKYIIHHSYRKFDEGNYWA